MRLLALLLARSFMTLSWSCLRRIYISSLNVIHLTFFRRAALCLVCLVRSTVCLGGFWFKFKRTVFAHLILFPPLPLSFRTCYHCQRCYGDHHDVSFQLVPWCFMSCLDMSSTCRRFSSFDRHNITHLSCNVHCISSIFTSFMSQLCICGS